MNPDKTYSVDSSAWLAWLASGQVVFSLSMGQEYSPPTIPMTMDELFIQGSIRPYPDTMLASEKALAKDWDSPEEDAAWSGL